MKFAIFSLIIFLAQVESKAVKNSTNESSAYKRMEDRALQLVESLFNAIEIIKPSGDTYSAQFGALYLHASSEDSILRLDHGDVLSTDFPDIIQLKPKEIVWPADDETNLAVAKIARLGLNGHSEYLLLMKLAAMLTYFQVTHQQACPTYIVIITKLPPCHKPNDQVGCTTTIIERFNEANNTCPHPATRYVVGHHEMPKTPSDTLDWGSARQLLENANIRVIQV